MLSWLLDLSFIVEVHIILIYFDEVVFLACNLVMCCTEYDGVVAVPEVPISSQSFTVHRRLLLCAYMLIDIIYSPYDLVDLPLLLLTSHALISELISLVSGSASIWWLRFFFNRLSSDYQPSSSGLSGN